jgi:hypothetical protein
MDQTTQQADACVHLQVTQLSPPVPAGPQTNAFARFQQPGSKPSTSPPLAAGGGSSHGNTLGACSSERCSTMFIVPLEPDPPARPARPEPPSATRVSSTTAAVRERKARAAEAAAAATAGVS